MVTEAPSVWRRLASTPTCQEGRSREKRTSPVRGSTTPLVPITNARSCDRLTRAESHARRTASCTVLTGSRASAGFTVTSTTVLPVMSATPTVRLSGSTSSPATYALEGTTP